MVSFRVNQGTLNILKSYMFLIVSLVIIMLISFIFSITTPGKGQTFIIYGAVFLLIIFLTITAFTIHYGNKDEEKSDSKIPQCPDYFEVLQTNNGIQCRNIQNIGTCSGDIDFSGTSYQGKDGICNKYNWAKKCGVPWDGITYGRKNPCIRESDDTWRLW